MSDGIRFRATIELGGKTANGTSVPDEVVAARRGRSADRPSVTVAAHTYRTLAHTHRKEWIRWIEEAKKPDTPAQPRRGGGRGPGAGKRNRRE